MEERTVRAVGVEIDQAPPATTLWHFLHSQMPTQVRFTVFFPQKAHAYLWITQNRQSTYVPCWLISIFFTILRREEP